MDLGTWAVGIDYNFYQTRNFNFRLGGYVRNFNVAEKIDIPYNTVNIDKPDNLTFTFSEGPNWNYNLNFSIEYIAFILKNHAINYYLGSEVMYFDQGASGTQTLNSLSINNIPVRETSFYFIEEKVTIGLTTGVGLYSRIGKTMIRTIFNYKFSLTGEIFSEFHRWKNLNNPSSSNIGFHGWNGHHFSCSITIHPGRKNIKERLRNLGQ